MRNRKGETGDDAGKKVISVIEMYEQQLCDLGAAKERMDPKETFASLSRDAMLAHAHYLCDGVKTYAREAAWDPTRWRKAGSHLTAVQMCLSFAGLYTLEELMEHNRSV